MRYFSRIVFLSGPTRSRHWMERFPTNVASLQSGSCFFMQRSVKSGSKNTIRVRVFHVFRDALNGASWNNRTRWVRCSSGLETYEGRTGSRIRKTSNSHGWVGPKSAGEKPIVMRGSMVNRHRKRTRCNHPTRSSATNFFPGKDGHRTPAAIFSPGNCPDQPSVMTIF